MAIFYVIFDIQMANFRRVGLDPRCSCVILKFSPMQESFPPEHSGELLADTLEQLLDGGAVADESGAHLSNKQHLGQY